MPVVVAGREHARASYDASYDASCVPVASSSRDASYVPVAMPAGQLYVSCLIAVGVQI